MFDTYKESADFVVLHNVIGDRITIPCAQRIADWMANIFDWLPKVNINMRLDLACNNFSPLGRMNGAKIIFEVDCEGAFFHDVTPEIQFYDPRLVTLNFLFHELAHMHDPSFPQPNGGHNDMFYQAEEMLKKTYLLHCQNFM
jgi:hypothetical protein